MKRIQRPLLLLGMALALGLPARAKSELPGPTNILFIFTDDQRWDTIAPLGNPEIKTPNLDRLVNRGFHFDNGELKVRDEMLAPHPRAPEVMRQHLADYYAVCTQIDHEAGRILDTVRQRGWTEDTI